MKKIFIMVLFLAFFTLPALAAAETYYDSFSKYQISFPENWKIENTDLKLSIISLVRLDRFTKKELLEMSPNRRWFHSPPRIDIYSTLQGKGFNLNELSYVELKELLKITINALRDRARADNETIIITNYKISRLGGNTVLIVEHTTTRYVNGIARTSYETEFVFGFNNTLYFIICSANNLKDRYLFAIIASTLKQNKLLPI